MVIAKQRPESAKFELLNPAVRTVLMPLSHAATLLWRGVAEHRAHLRTDRRNRAAIAAVQQVIEKASTKLAEIHKSVRADDISKPAGDVLSRLYVDSLRRLLHFRYPEIVKRPKPEQRPPGTTSTGPGKKSPRQPDRS